MKSPECLRIVPAIVEKKAVEDDSALPNKVSAESVDRTERIGLVVLREIADVVPGVVVQKGPVWMRALPFDVLQEVAPPLAGTRGSDHRRHRHRRFRPERQLAC